MNPPRADDDSDEPEVPTWAPLAHAPFRLLWFTWLIASLCMWMNDVAAAWLMTSLTDAPVMVALVQTAATLPIFLLGVPSGALADIADRRRLLMLTQVWAAAVAVVLALLSISGTLTPGWLLALVFANGVVLATRWPVFSAIVPGLVPRHELQAAMAFNGIANNGSRIAGPLAAGAVIASAGAQYVFALNAALSLAAVAMLSRWTQAPRSSALPSERFVGAMRVGLQHVRQSPGFQRVLVRSAAFFLQSIALIALLPLAARQIAGGGAGTFTLLLAGMGAGAVAGAFLLPRVTRATTPNRRVVGGTLAYGAATAAVALAPNLFVALPAMFAAGLAYMVAANTLMVAAQTALPDWVRARGLSIYQMVMMGANALGAACWGQVASQSSVTASLVVAALAGAVMLLLLRNVEVGLASAEDLVPARLWKMPELAVPVEADQGPVLVTVEYRIDPARTAEFLDVMRESRRVWLSHGLLAWSLFGDLSEKGRYIEHMLDESWASYVLRNERVASSYLPLRDRKHAFHLGPEPPAVTRYLGQTPSR